MATTVIEFPPGLTELLQNFILHVLKQQPKNLLKCAAEYFENLDGGKLNVTNNASLPSLYRPSPRFQPILPPELPRMISQIKNEYDSIDGAAGDKLSVPYETRGDSLDFKKIVYPKSEDQYKRLENTLKSLPIFQSIDKAELTEVYAAIFEKKVTPNEVITREGEPGTNFYIVNRGVFRVLINDSNSKTEKIVHHYDNEGFFGELSLLSNKPREATVISISNGSLWALDGTTFRRTLMKLAFYKRFVYLDILDSVPFLKVAHVYNTKLLADELVSKSYSEGSCIIKQGEAANCMFFVESGQVRITAHLPHGIVERELMICQKGDYFGELALLTDNPRAASAYAVERTSLAVLESEAFHRLLAPCMDVLKRNINVYKKQFVNICGEE